MDPRLCSAVFLTLSCWLWNAEGRTHNMLLKVPNGGKWGTMGPMTMCSKGYANGYSLKVQQPQGPIKDDTALNGIRLHCTNGEKVQSSTGPHGNWTTVEKCANGYLVSFALQVEAPQGLGDDTAANNIKFKCQNGQQLIGYSPTKWGAYGPWSDACTTGAICGIQSKVEGVKKSLFPDNTGLNDVQLACCD